MTGRLCALYTHSLVYLYSCLVDLIPVVLPTDNENPYRFYFVSTSTGFTHDHMPFVVEVGNHYRIVLF